MIHSKRGSLRRVALSGAVLASASMIGVLASPTLASAGSMKTSKTTFTLNCDTGIANGQVTVKTTQKYPKSVAAGASFAIQWKSETIVGGALGEAAYTLAPGGSEKGTITTDDDLSTDATPSTSNVAGAGLNEEGTIKASTFPVYTPPKKTSPKYFTTPDFTAGSAGTDTVSAGDDDATVTIYNKSGGVVTTTTADCTPAGTPAVIATIKVT